MLDSLSVLLKQLIKSAIVDAMREVERTSNSRSDTGATPRVEESMALLSVDEVAKVLGVSDSHVRRLTRSGELSSIRMGSVVRYRASSLRDWMDARETGTESLIPTASNG